VNEKSMIMLTSNEASSSDNRGEALKPSTRGLLEAIENNGDDRHDPQEQSSQEVGACRPPNATYCEEKHSSCQTKR
jgi:hypothetical protein